MATISTQRQPTDSPALSSEILADHVIVQNLFFGDPDDFIWLHGHEFTAKDGSKSQRGGRIKSAILEPLGYPIVSFPRVPGGAFALAEFERVPLAQLNEVTRPPDRGTDAPESVPRAVRRRGRSAPRFFLKLAPEARRRLSQKRVMGLWP